MGYLMPKPSSKKNSSHTIWLIAEGIKGVHTFPESISPKLNVIVWLEFEFTYYTSTDQHVNNYAMGTPTLKILVSCAGYKTVSDGGAPVLELWIVWTPSLLLLPGPWAGCDTVSIFKQSKASFNSKFFFS